MRFSVSYTALGLTLVFGASGAQAQTVITTQPAHAVVTTAAATVVQPAETTRTTRTVRTVRTFVPVKRQIITTRTVTRRVLPAETTVVAPPVAAAPPVVAETVAAAPHPFYNVAPAADIYSAPAYDYAYRAPAYDYGQPLYDVAPAPAPIPPAPVVAAPAVTTAPVVAAPVTAPVLATQPVIYRYVYEPDRILVIDPTTGVAVQAIPR
jgi:fused signal recognition particle receptor